MAKNNNTNDENSLATLIQEYKEQLSGKMTELTLLWETQLDGSISYDKLNDLYRGVHGLAGSGGTFGAVAISTIAHEIELTLKPFIKNKNDAVQINKITEDKVTQLLQELVRTEQQWVQSDIPFIEPKEKQEKLIINNSNLIYLAEDDKLLAENIVNQLEEANYKVRHFSELNEFNAACEKVIPAAIVMDIVFKEGEIAGTEAVSKLKNTYDSLPPIIFISVRNDIEARLAVARIGAVRYFSKPLDIIRLVATLDSLIMQKDVNPYRILLIDDDENLLTYYSTILQRAGMETKAISNPLKSLKALNDFNPDVILLDVYMPECSGMELAQVIRQDDSWAFVPIMFLSTETNLNIQLDAMNLGGDDFMIKPIEAGHLESAVLAKAKRARWTSRLNSELTDAIRESDYQLTTMNKHDIVSITDVEGAIIYANDKFCEISGYSRAELLGQNHRILKSSYQSDSFYKNLWNTITKGKVWNDIICNLKKNSEMYWIESTIVPFLDERGKPYKYVSACTDITSLRKSEERLVRSQKFANIGTWDWNIITGELYWSEGIWSLFGLSNKDIELNYDNYIAAIHPDDRQIVKKAIKNCVENHKDYNLEHRVVWPDGSIHWVHESGNVVRSNDGTAQHMLSVVQDITDRLEVEYNLRETEERLSFAIEGAGDGVWDWDIKSNKVNYSTLWMSMLGYSQDDFSDTIDSFYNLIHPEDIHKVQRCLQDYISGTADEYSVELRLCCKDDSYKWILSRGKIVEYDRDGHAIRLIGIHNDITKRKIIEQDLIIAREEAETANRAKSQFLSSMSHELRTPLNSILGFSQLMAMEKNNPLNESQIQNVNEILNAGEHLLALINEILDLAKIESGHIELSIESVELGEVIFESIQLILPLAKKRNITIRVLSDEEEITFNDLFQQEYVLRADHTRLKQIILNLLSNAVKYNSENGEITIRCGEINTDQIRISVTDTGDGLSEEMQAQLFTVFNRLGSEKSNIQGTGIGLVITKNLVELMGGTIGVLSKVGTGSTFWVDLIRDREYTGPNVISRKIKSPEKLDTLADDYEHSVLYIEDNPANLRLISKILGNFPNIHMWSAHEPLLGIELAMEHKPDIILLDINLPGMDGYEVLRKLRISEVTKDIAVIAVSANVMTKDIEKALAAGFDQYITKPINVNELLNTIQNKLNN